MQHLEHDYLSRSNFSEVILIASGHQANTGGLRLKMSRGHYVDLIPFLRKLRSCNTVARVYISLDMCLCETEDEVELSLRFLDVNVFSSATLGKPAVSWKSEPSQFTGRWTDGALIDLRNGRSKFNVVTRNMKRNAAWTVNSARV